MRWEKFVESHSPRLSFKKCEIGSHGPFIKIINIWHREWSLSLHTELELTRHGCHQGIHLISLFLNTVERGQHQCTQRHFGRTNVWGFRESSEAILLRQSKFINRLYSSYTCGLQIHIFTHFIQDFSFIIEVMSNWIKVEKHITVMLWPRISAGLNSSLSTDSKVLQQI